LSGRKLSCVFWIVSLLPAASAAATGICAYLYLGMLPHWSPWRYLVAQLAIAIGVAVPRFWVRFACMIALIPMIVIRMWSVGLFYLPTLALAVFAVLLRMESGRQVASREPGVTSPSATAQKIRIVYIIVV